MTGHPQRPARATHPVTTELPTAFWAFHDLYHRPYLEYAHLQLGDRHTAGELVHGTFIHLALCWRDMMETANHEAYAWAHLRERIADELRLQGRDPAVVETAAFARVNRAALETARDQLADMESALGLYSAISRLPERQFDVMVLLYVLGYPTQQAAHILGVTTATIRSQARHAKRKLAKDLDLPIDLTSGGDDAE